MPAGYLPLFPFASLADVRAWQASYESGGHQPWHRSPDLTATAFAAFLGYTDVTQVAQSAVSGGDAHVAVGIKLPDGTISTAAIIHLVLFGSGTYAPWEVVGTDDRTFTVDRPAYGGTAASPVTVGGTITGVDESIRVTVHSLSAQVPVGAYCCRAAGGTRSPWSASVTFLATPGQVITIAAATGGHVAAVERFAVTGARAVSRAGATVNGRRGRQRTRRYCAPGAPFGPRKPGTSPGRTSRLSRSSARMRP